MSSPRVYFLDRSVAGLLGPGANDPTMMVPSDLSVRVLTTMQHQLHELHLLHSPYHAGQFDAATRAAVMLALERPLGEERDPATTWWESNGFVVPPVPDAGSRRVPAGVPLLVEFVYANVFDIDPESMMVGSIDKRAPSSVFAHLDQMTLGTASFGLFTIG